MFSAPLRISTEMKILGVYTSLKETRFLKNKFTVAENFKLPKEKYEEMPYGKSLG